MIPYGKQWIDMDDLQVVQQVLQSDYLTCGPAVPAFEEALAAYCGASHAVAVANGTAALHLAMLVAGIGPGDRVLTTPNTFLASANCAEFVGATVDFVDIDPTTLCLSLSELKAAWSPEVKAVVAVDFAGYPCVSEEMAEFVHRQGAILIEDGCHAIGGSRDGHKVGGLPWVDMTTFSFHPVKTMTAGEGGAILTNNTAWYEKLLLLRGHGMTRLGETPEGGVSDLVQRTSETGQEAGPWLYAMTELGYNYRITDIQCALAQSQLTKLDRFIKRRTDISKSYDNAFADLQGFHRPTAYVEYANAVSPGWHLYVVQIDFDQLGGTRTQMMQHLRSQEILTQVHYIPVHLQPYYHKRYGYSAGKCPQAEKYYQQALSLPLYPRMQEKQVDRVVEVVTQALNQPGTWTEGSA